MTPKQLERIGRMLYGGEWQTPLAAAIGRADRTVRRWVAGDTAIPAGIEDDLLAAVKKEVRGLEDKTQRLQAVIDSLSDTGV